MLLEYQVMVSQVHGIGCVWKTPFRKSGHKYAFCNVVKPFPAYSSKKCTDYIQPADAMPALSVTVILSILPVCHYFIIPQKSFTNCSSLPHNMGLSHNHKCGRITVFPPALFLFIYNNAICNSFIHGGSSDYSW